MSEKTVKKSVQVSASIPEELDEKVVEYRFANRIDKKSEVVKIALEKLLNAPQVSGK